MKTAAFLLGVIFALGLGVAGMTQPQKVLAFLDVAGEWDPSLAFVMVGAIGVSFFPFHQYRKMARPLLVPQWKVPSYSHVDTKLVAGAALFGVGWGMAGICPGPALVRLAAADSSVICFTLALVLGMTVARFCFKSETKRAISDANRFN